MNNDLVEIEKKNTVRKNKDQNIFWKEDIDPLKICLTLVDRGSNIYIIS
jgi:hypothetical protein